MDGITTIRLSTYVAIATHGEHREGFLAGLGAAMTVKYPVLVESLLSQDQGPAIGIHHARTDLSSRCPDHISRLGTTELVQTVKIPLAPAKTCLFSESGYP